MSRLKKVLILSHRYAPMNVIGAVRVTKFVKFLPKFGWEPIVFTCEPRTDLYLSAGELKDEMSIGKVFRTKDYSFNELLVSLYNWIQGKHSKSRGNQASTHSISNKSSKFAALAKRFYKSFICFPDECILWRLFGMKALRNVIEAEKPDVILSSSLPNTVHLMASKVASEFEIPWVADFRDLWTQNPYVERVVILRSLERRIEARALKRAKALITVSRGLREQLQEKYIQPVYVVPNGYDPDDLRVMSVGHEHPESDQGKFSLTFTGSIYPGKRDPAPLFEAIKVLLSNGTINKENFVVRFYGRNQDFIASLLSERFDEISELIELNGLVSREEAISQQLGSTALLLLEWTDPKARGVYTGKIFEYLAAEKPILSIGPLGGDLQELITKTGAGYHGTDPDMIVELLTTWVNSFKVHGNVPYAANENEIHKFSREAQTEQLAEILTSVLGEDA